MEDVVRNPPVNRILDRLQETIKGNICPTISKASHKIDDRELRADAMMGLIGGNLTTETYLIVSCGLKGHRSCDGLP
jgi:hypothetical protein